MDVVSNADEAREMARESMARTQSELEKKVQSELDERILPLITQAAGVGLTFVEDVCLTPDPSVNQGIIDSLGGRGFRMANHRMDKIDIGWY